MHEEEPKKGSLAAPIILFILSLVYAVSPVDIIPDIPVFGWVDDLLVTAAAGLYLLEKTMADAGSALATMLRYARWIVILLGVIAVALLGLSLFGIIKLFTE